MSVLGGGGDQKFAYGLLLFSVSMLVLFSIILPMFPRAVETEENPLLNDLNTQYLDFTGSAPTSEAVWGLTGIYTPFGVDADGNATSSWGRTDDGWLYSQRVVNYLPSQYSTDANGYTASYDATTKAYYYTYASTSSNQHTQGDLYGSVVMDVNKKSNQFFTTAGKEIRGDGYYYAYDGYRYSFSPVQEYVTIDASGEQRSIIPNTTSLSLIWYDYYGNSGIAGQLIITGSDSGVAYLTSAQIVSAFNNNTSTSTFNMTFNGVEMRIHVRLDPVKLTSLSVEDCYNLGYWSVMVSSLSVDMGSYNTPDYEFNPTSVFETMIDLLTFNMDDYGIDGLAGDLATIVIVVPLMIGLIALGLGFYPVLIFAGIWGCLTAWSHGFLDGII